MKLHATDKTRLLRYKLQRLAERGIDGERATAKAKLARIESRWNFTGPAQAECGDIFAGIVYPSNVAAPLDAPFRDSELASFVKWALESAFHIRGGLRAGMRGEIIVTVEAARESLPTLNHIAGVITRSFAELWQTFAALPGATAFDAKAFSRGLFDGMMRDEREPGSLLPQRSGKVKRERREPITPPPELQHFAVFNRAVKKDFDEERGSVTWIRYYYQGRKIAEGAPDLNHTKLKAAFYKLQARVSRRTRAIVQAPALSIHPYEIALDLGRKIRLSVPIGELSAQLADHEQRARLAA